MKLTNYLAATALMTASSVAFSATIWTPTNEDTDFIQFDFAGITTDGGTLALFDDDTGFAGTALVIGSSGGNVVFTDNSDGSWDAQFFDVFNTPGATITLAGGNNFVLGIDWGAGYAGDTSYSLQSSPDTYLINFDGVAADGSSKSGSTLAVDLAPIPVPAAVWLFGSGLLGLVGVARRRV
jgi:hypothetical protein